MSIIVEVVLVLVFLQIWKSENYINRGSDAMDLIKQYIIALTNLYGQVPTEVVVDIYNSQNEDQIGIDDVEAYFDEDMSKQYVYAYKDHFVHEVTQGDGGAVLA